VSDQIINHGEATITVRSKQQAMDWSLVLASQGIETTIDPPGEDHGWRLLLDARDAERAFKALRQYRVENRGWSAVWRDELRWPARLPFDWRGLGWAALLAAFYWLSEVDVRVAMGGIMNSEAVHAGQWWRIFTAMQLHEDIAHLAANLTLGILLFGLTMGQWGAGMGLFLPYLAGAAGNVATLLVNRDDFNGLGASGMVMGALGLLAAHTVAMAIRQRKLTKQALGGLAAGIMLFAFYGTSPGSDIVAHTGGFAAGIILGILPAFMPEYLMRGRNVNLTAGLTLAVMLATTWWLALHSLLKK
jgi:rhomboid protease GluP